MIEKDENVKKNEFGFGVNNCPLWLFRIIDSQAKQMYNDQRWVLLVDWFRKAQAYDLLSQGVIPEPIIQEPEQVTEKEEPKVKLFGKGD